MLQRIIHQSNGVKQGGCIAPTLFSMYVYNVIDVLRPSNIVCRYGNYYRVRTITQMILSNSVRRNGNFESISILCIAI